MHGSLGKKENEISTEEAARILGGSFGLELKNIARNCIAPFFWFDRQLNKYSNGTMFFLDTGKKQFAVTANHVFEGYKKNLTENPKTILQIGDNTDFNPIERLIDSCPALDIATFDFSEKDVNKLEKRFLKGYQREWPPNPPQIGKGVFFAGYPAKERVRQLSTINFGIFAGLCVVEGISEENISLQLKPEESIEMPPDDYDPGGISGSPLITLVQNGLFYWRLGGVIYEASSNYGIFFARHASTILENGELRR